MLSASAMLHRQKLNYTSINEMKLHLFSWRIWQYLLIQHHKIFNLSIALSVTLWIQNQIYSFLKSRSTVCHPYLPVVSVVAHCWCPRSICNRQNRKRGKRRLCVISSFLHFLNNLIQIVWYIENNIWNNKLFYYFIYELTNMHMQ